MASCSYSYQEIVDENVQQLKQLHRFHINLQNTLKNFSKTLEINPTLRICDYSLKIIEHMCKILFLMRRKTLIILHKYSETIIKIRYEINIKRTKSTQKIRKKRLKLQNILAENNSLKNSNCEKSFYFRFNGMHYENRNSDFQDITESGYRFLSCLHIAIPWRQTDTKKFLNGIRHLLMQEKFDELLSIINEYDEMKNSNSSEEKLKKHKDHSLYLNNYLLRWETSDLPELLKNENITREFNWNIISKKFLNNRHSPEECQRIWHLIANPSISKKPWLPEEDMLLRKIVIDNKLQNWQQINEKFSRNRTEFLCFIRYQTNFKYMPRKILKKWTKKDNLIIDKIIKNSESNSFLHLISELSSQFKNVSSKQILCHVKYINSIRNKKKGFFNKREKYLINSYASKGYSYKAIAQILGNRTLKQIKDYHSALCRKSVHGNWSETEIRTLLKAVKYVGEGQWTKISKFLNGRSPVQCCQKFLDLKLKRYNFVYNYIEKVLPNNKVALNEIKSLMKNQKKIKKESKILNKSVDQKIELYFMKNLEANSSKEVVDKVLFVKYIKLLLNFLNFKINFNNKNIGEIYDWIISENQSTDKSYSVNNLFQNFSSSNKNKNYVMNNYKKNCIFSEILCKSSNVFPPNKCSLYAFSNFMENYQLFVQKNSDVDFKKLWLQIDSVQKHNKEYVEAKILWYRILKAMFYWTIKLNHVLPEKLLK